MRVLIIDHTGGIETFRERYRILATYPDVELTVLAPETWIENQRLVRAGTESHGYRILTGRAGFRGYENRGFFYTGLTAAIRKARPDVLHLIEEPFSLIALQSALLCKSICPKAKIIFYSFDNLHMGFRYPYRPSWGYGLIQRAVHRLSDCGAVSCRDAREILLSRGFTKPIRYLPFGIDPDLFSKRDASSRRAALGLRSFVIGFAGRLIPAKGVDILLEALARLRTDWSFLVVGGGPEAASIEDFARSRGWENRLRIERNVSHADVPDAMNLMDVLVLPSRTTPKWKEQFGRVLIEAMGCAIPVVGSDSGAIPEVIGDGGIIVPEGNAEELAQALGDLQQDPRKRAKLGSAGRTRVLNHFTWQRVAELYKTIYDGLLDESLTSEEVPEWSTSSS